MERFYNKHYIIVRSDNSIVDGWSDGLYPERNTADAICINERGSYQFRLYSEGEENPLMYTIQNIPLYKWDGSKVIRRTEEEINYEYIQERR